MRSIADSIGKLTAVLDDTSFLSSPFDDIPFYNGSTCFEDWRKESFENNYYFVVTIGNPHGNHRRKISDKLINEGLVPINLIHESAIIDETVKIGKGVQIHAGVIINAHARIGDYCILNTRSLIEHDCELADGVEVAPGAILCGEVSIGENSWIGASSVVRQHVTIGNDVIVGAGAAVVKNVNNNQIIAGIPAVPLKNKCV